MLIPGTDELSEGFVNMGLNEDFYKIIYNSVGTSPFALQFKNILGYSYWIKKNYETFVISNLLQYINRYFSAIFGHFYARKTL